jgi:hypothetical protein
VASAPHGHQLDRALNAKTTLLCVPAGCLFPGEGYDEILRITFGMPRPGPQARHPGSRRPVVRRSTGHAAGTLAAPYGRPTLLDAN